MAGLRGSAYESLIEPAPAKAAPARPVPVRAPQGAPLRGGLAPAPPRAPAQRVAQKRVETAQKRLPAQPVPEIPYIANPTPAQTHAALELARAAQSKALGPHPGVARIREYQQELANDPRQKAFRETIAHYVRAAEGHLDAMEGRRVASGNTTMSQPSTVGIPASVAVALGRLARQQQPANQRATPLVQSPGVGVSLPIVGRITAPAAVSAAIAPKIEEDAAAAGVLKKVPGEVVGLPQQTALSLFDTGKAGVQAAEGKPQGLEAIAGALLHQVTHPAQSFERNPLTTTLAALGAEAGVGEAAGAAARSGVLGDAAADAASTARPDLELYGGEKVTRRYSGDPARKALQVAKDNRRSTPTQAEGAELQRLIKGGMVRPGRVDVAVDQGEQLRRSLVGHAKSTESVPRPRVGADAVAEMVEGTLHPNTLESDLAAQRGRLVRAQEIAGADGGPLVGPELEANKAELARVEKLLGDKEFIASKGQEAHQAAQAFVAAQRPRQAALLRLGALKPEQLRASLFPYAQARMGARYFSEGDHLAAENEARVGEHAARQQLGAVLDRRVAAEKAEKAVARAVRDREAEPGVEADARVEEALRAMAGARRPAGGELEAAGSALEQVRERRVAVSGRDPVALRAHEDALSAAAVARHDVAQAQDAVRRAELARARLGGARGAARPSQDAAVEGAGDRLAAADAKIRGAKEALGVAQKRRAEAMAARDRLPPIKAGLRHHDGRYLPTEEILAHMRENGVEPGFLSHEASLPQRGSFFKPSTQRPALLSKTRTGESFVKGTYDRSHGALIAQAAKEANEIAGHSGYNKLLNRFGVGVHDTKEDAEAAGANFSHTPEGERVTHALGPLVPKLIGPEQVVEKDLVHPADVQAVMGQFGLDEHTPVSAAHVGKYTNLPQMVDDRIKAHEALRATSELRKAGGWATQKWRQAQLYLSPRWLFGSPQEHGVRLATAGIAPKIIGGRAGRFGDRLSTAMDDIGAGRDPVAAQRALEAKHALVAGTIYDSAEKLSIIRKSDQFDEMSKLGRAGSAGERAAATGAGKTALAPWNAWHGFVSKAMHRVEVESRKAALGKTAMRDIHAFNGKWTNVLKMTDGQVKDYVAGRLDKNKVEQLVKETDEMMGAWGHLSPTVRGAYQTFSPFGLWWLTSMRFLRRLPINAPVKTGIAAALYNATEPERDAEGQGVHPSVPEYEAGSIQAKLPIVGNVDLQPTYYTPGGVGIEPGKTAADMILPQVEGVMDAISKRDPLTGEALTAPGQGGSSTDANWQQALLTGLAEAGVSMTPGARQAEQLVEHGGKPYGTSVYEPWDVKPGSKRPLNQVLTKILAPTRFTYAGSTGGTTGSGSSSASGGLKLSPAQQAQLEAAEHAKAGAAPARSSGLSAAEELQIERALAAQH
jgi:hypothetical protein